MNISININRLLHNIQKLGKIGENADGGMDRPLGSEADVAAREWLKAYWRTRLGVEPVTDAAANLWGTWNLGQARRPIAVGSHHDTVPDGGKYDGALGVLIAMELMETLREHHVSLRHPLAVVSFTGEEPNPYNVSTLGSKAVSGRLGEEDIKKAYSRDTGELLGQAILRLGGDPGRVSRDRLTPESLAAYLECHIEQGHRLEDSDRAVAAVTCITGIYREEIRVLGEANHAGTTCMADRKDSFLGAAEFALGLEGIVKQYDDVVATSGYVKVIPNEANIIPGETVLIIDVRTCSTGRLEEVVRQIDRLAGQAGQGRGLTIRRKVVLNQPPVPMAREVQDAVEEGCRAVGAAPVSLDSMAGHDAANMARVTKSGMMFVRSAGGRSHCREEYTGPEDIATAGNAMLAAVLALDAMLE